MFQALALHNMRIRQRNKRKNNHNLQKLHGPSIKSKKTAYAQRVSTSKN